MREVPGNQHWLKRLTAFARVIVFDKREPGLSDLVAEMTLEERIGDVRAVMDAAGFKRATIYGWSEGAQMIGIAITLRRQNRRGRLTILSDSSDRQIANASIT
jgi:pimeloyl-ACP methyl ester carboxylesterase